MTFSIRSKKGKKQRMDDLHFDWDESIFKTMASPARPITTVLILKPDAVRKHAGKVFRRIHQEGFSLVGLKMMVLTSDFAKAILQPECADVSIFDLDEEQIITGYPIYDAIGSSGSYRWFVYIRMLLL